MRCSISEELACAADGFAEENEGRVADDVFERLKIQRN
jgi:hypothetical protein